MTGHMVTVQDGRYQVYRTPDGIRRETVGPDWATPRGAIVYAATLDGDSGVSPLRVPVVPSAARPVASLRAGDSADGTAGPRERVQVASGGVTE
jgi:hypothetical protein